MGKPVPINRFIEITLIGILLLAAGWMVVPPRIADAKLLVFSPEKALQSAELIITGTVTERDYEVTRRSVTIKVEDVPKGRFEKDKLTLEMEKNPVYGWVGFNFPEPKTKIFLLLRGNSERGYWLAQDLNCVALVENGHVTELYYGSRIGIDDKGWTMADYVHAYDLFYQEHKLKEADQKKAVVNVNSHPGANQGKKNLLSRIRDFIFNLVNKVTHVFAFGSHKISANPISSEEQKRVVLYLTAMKAAFEEENGGNKFIAVKLETLDGLSNKGKQMVLDGLKTLSPHVYSFEKVKDDADKFLLDDKGRLLGTKGGTLLYVDVQEYKGNKAVIEAVSWFGNSGAVMPKYEARYINGMWQLKLIRMAVA